MSVNQFGKLFNRNPAKPDGAAVADEQKFPVTGAQKGAPHHTRQAEAVNPPPPHARAPHPAQRGPGGPAQGTTPGGSLDRPPAAGAPQRRQSSAPFSGV